MATTKSARKSTSTSRSSSSSRSMDVTTFLKKEHDTVEQLMARLKKTTGPKSRWNLAQRICMELLVHTEMEEKSFYPEMRNVPEVADLVQEGYQEHHEVEELIQKARPMEPSDPQLMPLMQQIEKGVKHHVREEEQEMFPKLKKACSREHLMELTKTLKQAKAAVKREMQGQEQPGERRVREDVAVGEMGRIGA
ncbi:MAG TPA: hemerythrin domain-containing protein [Chloroflexota bacterium]|nr:hemerythrin domain-containing protein [Chloroflexota bacterium]